MMSISEVSRQYRVSTRTLRYYEQIGLLGSVRTMDYAYRTYDEEAVKRLECILLLRRLKLPLKDIQDVLAGGDGGRIAGVFERKLREMEREAREQASIRPVLRHLADTLVRSAGEPVEWQMLIGGEGNGGLAALTVPKAPIPMQSKEDAIMETKSFKETNPGTGGPWDVRIVYLPPATVAASHCVGDEPEYQAGLILDRFVLDSRLCERKPDLRHYGFNHPNPVDDSGYHGYERWVTIPEEMEVPAPLVKKSFAGGLYAAHAIPMGNFHEWGWLHEWVLRSEQYEFRFAPEGAEVMHGSLEEHLNYVNHVKLGPGNTEPPGMQLDLLIPIREKADSLS